MSQRLIQQQLPYFFKLAQRDGQDPVRGTVFAKGSLDPVPLSDVRRVGRPRLKWANEARKHAAQAAGDFEEFARIVGSGRGAFQQWARTARGYVG